MNMGTCWLREGVCASNAGVVGAVRRVLVWWGLPLR